MLKLKSSECAEMHVKCEGDRVDRLKNVPSSLLRCLFTLATHPSQCSSTLSTVVCGLQKIENQNQLFKHRHSIETRGCGLTDISNISRQTSLWRTRCIAQKCSSNVNYLRHVGERAVMNELLKSGSCGPCAQPLDEFRKIRLKMLAHSSLVCF